MIERLNNRQLKNMPLLLSELKKNRGAANAVSLSALSRWFKEYHRALLTSHEVGEMIHAARLDGRCPDLIFNNQSGFYRAETEKEVNEFRAMLMRKIERWQSVVNSLRPSTRAYHWESNYLERFINA